uniref:Uncharacterized protein n=1 Tax=Saccoglossus kowalevskii TaxID=10224 RepID=A0ABM0M3A1_SACKO|nr:PREDICTED: putative uncharacterized protein DDB_G0294196-like [Saccoglossus kowalevskii]
MTEKELATDTLEAQLEEENRKKRLLELQKQQAELQKQQSELQKTMETKAASPPPLKPLPPPPFLMPIQSSTSNGSFHLSALLDKPQSAAPIMPSLSYQKIDVARQIPMPNLKTEFEKLLKVDEPECIVLDSSSSGEEDSKRQQEQQKEDCDVIEISSSDETSWWIQMTAMELMMIWKIAGHTSMISSTSQTIWVEC